MNPQQQKVTTIEPGEASFESEVLKAKPPVLVAFCAPWSRPCQVLESVLVEVATACAGKVKVIKVNADDNPELSLWYGVQSIPTLLYFDEGKLRGKVVGTASKTAILARMKKEFHGHDAQSLTADASQE